MLIIYLQICEINHEHFKSSANPYIYIYIYILKSNSKINAKSQKKKKKKLFLPILSVRGLFSVAQPRVARWRDNLTRPGFSLGSCVRNLTLGYVVQWLPVYF